MTMCSRVFSAIWPCIEYISKHEEVSKIVRRDVNQSLPCSTFLSHLHLLAITPSGVKAYQDYHHVQLVLRVQPLFRVQQTVEFRIPHNTLPRQTLR